MLRYLTALVVAATMLATVSPAATPAARAVTLMTYNVHGLPWPIVEDRSSALQAIGDQLKIMRDRHVQPGIVAVQEAFVPEAKAIGRTAGYRYVAFGPAEDADGARAPGDGGFVADGSRLVGERLGKHVDSGLAIFSDYPIVAVRRMAYPVCAGYDCLANKGALAALIAVPGIATPILVIDTHLNSNGASGAANTRAIYAYRRQLDLLSNFIAALGAGDRPVLVAGDFNVGRDLARRAHFDLRMFGGSDLLQAAAVTCSTAPACPVAQPLAMAESLGRAKDWLMYRASPTIAITPIALAAPFGRRADGSMLSDHIGIVAQYRIERRAAPQSAVVDTASR
ncbi:hypothetical protein ASF00_10935 [Sphingomonas sp. Leaf34]|jgi:endonuclease/exonuclease/phosphatase family metal-dependent hydrolase|uniref:endonuclease/exonuclease/phosphatase family protein n=1 Tax=Sphingomonas sp. Leaf34 TaxID=1736216 RepID=UPI0006F75CD8|nr:endonuclease/exonuclease/phosphatase family protein [Sphingomonas sp. Leaf34]KQN28358.1 hypothetical protein ASF00_10935 [Sphingomonas sp. Leaf34]